MELDELLARANTLGVFRENTGALGVRIVKPPQTAGLIAL